MMKNVEGKTSSYGHFLILFQQYFLYCVRTIVSLGDRPLCGEESTQENNYYACMRGKICLYLQIDWLD